MDGSETRRSWSRDLIAAAIVLLVLAAFAVFLRPFYSPRHSPRRAMACRNNLKQIGMYIALYESKFSEFPGVLGDLWRPDMAMDPGLFVCEDRTQKEFLDGDRMKWPAVEAISDYEYRRPPDKMPAEAAEKYLVAWERVAHKDGTRAVLFWNGGVEIMDDAEFHAAVAEK